MRYGGSLLSRSAMFHWEQHFPAAGQWIQQFFPADTV